VATVSELPAGWLGKNHALNFGAARASGSLLLFTDADIIMQPDVLRRAVYYLEEEKLDHLAMTPDVEMQNWLLEAFIVIFTLLFSIFTQPWKLRDPNSPAHVGIGAFNLLRTHVYQKIGTHQAIAMRPDDDLKLGKIVKMHRYAQDLVLGQGFLMVRWYASLRELIDGLMKNAFSAVEYHAAYTIFVTLLMIVVNIWPFAAVWVTTGAVRWLYLTMVAMHAASYLAAANRLGARWWGVFAYPVVFALFVYIQWRAMFLTYYNNGIYWRDTHYSLVELRGNKV
jgi:cellulose synthase/poly-beta-1,6-N-acetylglucosamine synthase-like glycosyltransferase